MQIHSATFVLSAPDLAPCPDSPLPAFAFIGRSNVGKSSMINMLTNRKDLAKVSATPGKTKLINFFAINAAWHLIDLPGYGYAKVAQRHRKEFSKAISEYLSRRENLRLTFVLIDSRLDPQQIDLEFLTWLAGTGIPFALVFTKADKLKPRELQRNTDAFRQALADACGVEPLSFTTSSKERLGRGEILGHIDSLLAAAAQ
jgi:GTP-binding protein